MTKYSNVRSFLRLNLQLETNHMLLLCSEAAKYNMTLEEFVTSVLVEKLNKSTELEADTRHEPTQLKIELGKYYKTREGIVVGPVELSIHPDQDIFPFMVGPQNEGIRGEYSFTPEGKFLPAPGAAHKLDLVEEVPNPITKPIDELIRDTPESKPPFKLEAGKRYKTRDGQVAGPIELNTGWGKTIYPFVGCIDGVDHKFTGDGLWVPREKCGFDLVEETE